MYSVEKVHKKFMYVVLFYQCGLKIKFCIHCIYWFPGDLVEEVSKFAELLGWKEELEKLIEDTEGEYRVWIIIFQICSNGPDMTLSYIII